MLWIKSFHIIFIVTWFAGLLYLPRIFVNLALEKNPVSTERLLTMARRLYRLMTPLAVVAVVAGVWLWMGYRIGIGPGNGWMHAKLLGVLLVVGYHHACGRLLKRFEMGTHTGSNTWLSWFNVVPVVLLVAIVVLVVVKP